MNIVAAVLLLFLEEESAFYALCAIVQQVPEYYTQEMIGTIFSFEDIKQCKGETLLLLIISMG